MPGCTVRARRHPRRRAIPASVAITLLLVVLVGCADEPEFEWPDDPAAEPTPSLSTAESETTAELLARFDEFRQTEVAAQADPEPAHLAQEAFEEFLADPLLSTTLFELQLLHDRGLVRRGQPSWQVEVTDLRLEADPPTATIQDCLDTTGWLLAHQSSGTIAEPSGLPARYSPARHLMEFTATRYDDGWRLAEARTERDQSC